MDRFARRDRFAGKSAEGGKIHSRDDGWEEGEVSSEERLPRLLLSRSLRQGRIPRLVENATSRPRHVCTPRKIERVLMFGRRARVCVCRNNVRMLHNVAEKIKRQRCELTFIVAGDGCAPDGQGEITSDNV